MAKTKVVIPDFQEITTPPLNGQGKFLDQNWVLQILFHYSSKMFVGIKPKDLLSVLRWGITKS